MKQDIDFLINAFESFKVNPHENFEGLSQNDVISLAKLIILDLPRYRVFTEEDFADFKLQNYEDILKTEAVAQFEANIPEDLQGLVENLRKHREEVAANKVSTARVAVRTEIDRKILAFRNWSVVVNKAVSKKGQEDYPTAEESDEIRRVAKDDPERFIGAVALEIQKENEKILPARAVEAAAVYVSNTNAAPLGQIAAPIVPDKILGLSKVERASQVVLIHSDFKDLAKMALIPLVLSESDSRKNLVNLVKTDPEKFSTAVFEKITKESTTSDKEALKNLVNDYTDRLTNLGPNDAIPVIDPERLEIKVLPVTRAKNIDPTAMGAFNNVLLLAMEDAAATSGPADLLVIPKIEPQNVDNAARIVSQSASQESANVLLPNGKNIPGIDETLSSGFNLSPLQMNVIKTTVVLGGPAMANGKDKTEGAAKAAASQFYYIYGVTEKNFKLALKKAGVTSSTADKVAGYLKQYQEAHPEFAITVAAERAGISPRIIEGSILRRSSESVKMTSENLQDVFRKAGATEEQIRSFAGALSGNEAYIAAFEAGVFAGPGAMENVFTGPADQVYTRLNNQLPAVGGIRGYFLRAGQQIFGRPANAVFNRLLNNGLARAGKKAISSTAVAIGSFEGPLGFAVGFIVGKISDFVSGTVLPFIKRNFGWITGIIGGIAGFALFGGLGGIIGGLGGIALGGEISGIGAIAAIFAFFAAVISLVIGAIMVPLIFTFVVVPIIIAFIVFIINAGAYVVPYATNLSSDSGGQGTIYPAVSCFVFKEDPGYPWSPHRRDIATQSINFLLTNTPDYINALCGRYVTITLTSGTLNSNYWGDASRAGGEILFNAFYIAPSPGDNGNAGGAFNDIPNGVYLLAHELGHKYARGFGDIYAKYSDTPVASAARICTYPGTNSQNESFAESIADYVSGSPVSPGAPRPGSRWGCLGGQSFQSLYPSNWKFVHDNIIKEQLGWPTAF